MPEWMKAAAEEIRKHIFAHGQVPEKWSEIIARHAPASAVETEKPTRCVCICDSCKAGKHCTDDIIGCTEPVGAPMDIATAYNEGMTKGYEIAKREVMPSEGRDSNEHAISIRAGTGAAHPTEHAEPVGAQRDCKHECGNEGLHGTCTCVKCGALYPNRESGGAQKDEEAERRKL